MKKTFTKEQLVAFGNYLLSKKRRRITSPELRGRVTHADVSNFEEMVPIVRTRRLAPFLSGLQYGLRKLPIKKKPGRPKK